MKHSILQNIICTTALLAVAGCMVGPAYHPPKPSPQDSPDSYKESPTQFKGAPAWMVARPQDAMLHGKWWQIFRDPQLDSLEDQLDINNQNIKLYFQNFMAARDLIAEARSQLYPTVTVGASYSRSRSPLINTGGATIASSSPNRVDTLFSTPLEVSWEPDLWGRVRSAVNQAAYNAQMSAADLENERLTEQSALAVYFFEIRGQDALQKIYNDTVASDKKLLELTQVQYDTGIGDLISVVEAQNTLQSAEATAASIGIARAQYEHAIAMLVGKNASGFSIAVDISVATPPAVPIGLPSQLLERRPDIAAAERTMAAANSQVGIEAAAFYPDLTLSAEAGFESSALKTLFDWPSRFWSVGPSLSYTVFDAGLRQATVDQYIAIYNGDLAGYRQTVLTAFQQVEDNLASIRLLAQQEAQAQLAVDTADKYVKLELDRYNTGIDPYADVVLAENTALGDQQTLLTARVQQLTSAVQLITALGGGWDLCQLPTTQQVSQ
jgi:NodT family efflux transporter outer membrane factor (OMF) lipoprotein